MKTLLTLLLATLCAATVYGQTIRTLGFNTTNGEIVYSGTNALTFTNEVLSFSYGPGLLISNGVIEGNGRSIAFEDGAVSGTFNFQNAVEFSAAAATRTNIGLGATWLTNTNVTNFRTAIGLGSANAVSFSTVAAQEIYDSVGNKVIDLENFILGVGATAALEWATNQVQLNVPIVFVGTNSASATRTNLGLGLPLLTNASITNFQNALFSTNTAPTNTTNVSAWTTIQIGTNAFRIPLYQ